MLLTPRRKMSHGEAIGTMQAYGVMGVAIGKMQDTSVGLKV